MKRLVRLVVLGAALAGLSWPASAQAQPYPSEVVGFEQGSVNVAGAREMWQIPETSGSTYGIMMNTTGAENNNTSRRSTVWGGHNSSVGYQVVWEWVDDTDPEAWVRLTTFNTSDRPNPGLDTTGKITFWIANNSFTDFTEVGMCVGIRETGTDVPQLEDGGTAGGIEWVGVDKTDSIIECGTNGCDVGTLILNDDILIATNGIEYVDWGADRQLDSTAAGDDEVHFGYFRSALSTKIPIPVVTIPVTFVWSSVEVDLSNGDIKIDSTTYDGGIVDFANGDGVLNPPGDRGTLEHLAFTKVPVAGQLEVDLVIDEVQFIANQTDPARPPTVVAPIIDGDPQVTVTGLQYSVDQVSLYVNSTGLVETKAVTNDNDVVFNLVSPAVSGEVYTATQREGDSGAVSEHSFGVTVSESPPPYTFSILLDEGGTGSCDFTTGGWEWVGVTAVSGYVPQGTPIITNDAVWQTIDIPLDDSDVVIGGLGGDGQLLPSVNGVYTMDSLWFTVAAGVDSNGWEVFIDAIQTLDEFGQVTATILNMEDGVNRLSNPRGQSSVTPDSSALSSLASYDGGSSHRLTWTYEDPASSNPNQAIGMLQRLQYTCATSALIDDTSAAIRFHLLCRGQPVSPALPLPQVAAPIIVGNQDSVRVETDAAATLVELFINGISQGTLVPGGRAADFTGLTLEPGDSVSATQTIGTNGVSDYAYPRGVTDSPLPPVVSAPIAPGAETVTMTGVLAAPFATASSVDVYVNDNWTTNGPGGSDTVVLSIDALAQDDVVTATQTVNGVTSGFSDPVIVDFPVPVIYAAPAEGDSSVTVMGIVAGMETATVADTNGFIIGSAPVPPGADRVDVPVSGLVEGDMIVAYQSAGGLDSGDSDPETVTTNVVSSIIPCDSFETYADQVAMETVWTQSGTGSVVLANDNNATCPSGVQSAYGASGTAYMTQAIAETTPTDTNPLVLNVNIYDSYGVDPAGRLTNWVELNHIGGPDWFYMHVGMLGWANTDNVHYDLRAIGNGGPNWVDLDEYDGPDRSVGWHTFTFVHKGRLIDVYVDGLLSLKNLQLTSDTTYARADIGGGYSSEGVWFDDFCVTRGPVEFGCIVPQAPPPPSVGSPVLDGDQIVTVTDVDPEAISVTVWDDLLPPTPLGTVSGNPVSTNGVVDVTLVRALVHQERITATQTNTIDVSNHSEPMEVGDGNGPIMLGLGIRETGSAGPLGSEDPIGTGSIEWINVTTNAQHEEVGISVTPMNQWQTITFDPANGVHGFTGDGILDGTRGTLEHLAIWVDGNAADRSNGVFRMYVDNVVNVNADGQGDFLIADFEGFDLGSEVLFQEPTFSGSTDIHLSYPPSASEVSDDYASGGTQSALLSWFWMDTDTGRWVRDTTSAVGNVPSPIIDITRPVRMDILLMAGCATVSGDMDSDCDIDVDDYTSFEGCLLGTGTLVGPACICADFNGDGDVDLGDFSGFQLAFTDGAPVPDCP